MLNDEVNAVDVDPVADVIGMLDEEEDAGAGELLDCAGEGEGERHQGGGVEGHVFEEVLREESGYKVISIN